MRRNSTSKGFTAIEEGPVSQAANASPNQREPAKRRNEDRLQPLRHGAEVERTRSWTVRSLRLAAQQQAPSCPPTRFESPTRRSDRER
jgi:hypothetical protein